MIFWYSSFILNPSTYHSSHIDSLLCIFFLIDVGTNSEPHGSPVITDATETSSIFGMLSSKAYTIT